MMRSVTSGEGRSQLSFRVVGEVAVACRWAGASGSWEEGLGASGSWEEGLRARRALAWLVPALFSAIHW